MTGSRPDPPRSALPAAGTPAGTPAAGGRWPCERYTRDGMRCPRRTDHADRWCRAETCPGYLRARPDSAPPVAGAFLGGVRHVALTADVRVGLDVDETPDVRVSQRALDCFRYHHGGSEAAAASQLLAMLEDFLLRSARTVTRGGFLRLAAQGYELVLSPDRLTVTSYKTVHRERTWQQVQAGVPSRFGGNRYADYPPYLEPTGPPIAAGRAPASTDAATVRVSRRAMQNWARIERQRTGRTGLPLAELEAGLRDGLAQALSGGTTSTHAGSGVHEVEHGAVTWLLTCDCTGVIGARTPREDPA